MDNLKEALVMAMENYFGEDTRRINHARRVTSYAEQLMALEGGDYTVVIGTAVLHDIGIHNAEKKYGSSNGNFQEIEGPPVAREILTRLKFGEPEIDEICEIIGNHHSPGKINTQNFKILYDSDWLVNVGDEFNITDKAKLANIIDRVFLTRSGKRIAKEIYLR